MVNVQQDWDRESEFSQHIHDQTSQIIMANRFRGDVQWQRSNLYRADQMF